MPDYEVRHLASRKLETTIFDCENVLEARNNFARQKGYKDWGNMVVKFRDNRHNELQKPPYIFNRKEP